MIRQSSEKAYAVAAASGKAVGSAAGLSPRYAAMFAAMALTAGLTQQAFAQATLPVNIGELVHTFEAPNDLGQTVVTLVDTTPASLSAATLNANYLAPIFWNAGAGSDEWTLPNLGQVYGVALDGSYPNIYVTAATQVIYPSSTTVGPLGPGGVYRLDGAAGAICPLITLPNDPVLRPGLGNITYSPRTNSLYVSNFENGLIYRLPLGASASNPACPIAMAATTTYDHGLNGRPAAGFLAIPDDGLPGLTALGRRVWGLAVHPGENRLYYSVWYEDATNQSATNSNEVWSVGLSATGAPVATTARREFVLPAFAGSFSNPVAGLNFTPTGSLLVGERSYQSTHESRLLEYTGATTAWVAQPVAKYRVGDAGHPNSCSGAGDMDCSNNVWSAGDALNFNPAVVYGLIRIPSGGNPPPLVNPTQFCYLIDSDHETTTQDKTWIGSLVYRKECAPCRTTAPSGVFPVYPPDQRCGDVALSTYHYSIDAIGLPNNPGGFVSVGQRNLPSGFPGLHIVIWDRSGNIVRQSLFATSLTNELIVPTSVRVDATCNLLVAGRTQQGSTLGTFVAKFDSLIVPVWARRIPGNMSGGENVQADWLSDGSIIVSGMDGTGNSPAIGRLTHIDAVGTIPLIPPYWSNRYTSGFGLPRRFIIEDVEQAPGANGNIWVCGGMDWPVGASFSTLPMIAEFSLTTGALVGSGITVFPFPATSPWVTGHFNAIKNDPTIGAFQNDIVVAGYSTKPGSGPLPTPVTAARVASIDRLAIPAQHWDFIYSTIPMIPGTSAISIPLQGVVGPNNIQIAGRTADSPFNSPVFGLTARVAEATGALQVAQRHGSPSVGNSSYGFTDITPGGYRVMIGGFSDLSPFGGGSQLWFSDANCPTSFTSALEPMPLPFSNSELFPTAIAIAPLTLVEKPVVSPCARICGRCYANCDGSSLSPILNVIDFQCFLNKFASGDDYANCDESSQPPVLNVNDFQCFLNAYAAGCE